LFDRSGGIDGIIVGFCFQRFSGPFGALLLLLGEDLTRFGGDIWGFVEDEIDCRYAFVDAIWGQEKMLPCDIGSIDVLDGGGPGLTIAENSGGPPEHLLPQLGGEGWGDSGGNAVGHELGNGRIKVNEY